MDEVRLWNRELSATEVSQYFRTSLGVSSGVYSGLMMSITFQNDESFGTLFNLHDWSENSNNENGRNVTAFDQSNKPYHTISPNECAEFDGNEDYLENIDSLRFAGAGTNYLTLECWIFPRIDLRQL